MDVMFKMSLEKKDCHNRVKGSHKKEGRNQKAGFIYAQGVKKRGGGQKKTPFLWITPYFFGGIA
jgi:hypothetical protein